MMTTQGAEALVREEGGLIIKERISKTYRHPTLDQSLRAQRTKREASILRKLQGIIPVPSLHSADTYTLVMERIAGMTIARCATQNNYAALAQEIGQCIRKMHDTGIIHGDLTTSNMILHETQQSIYVIDFGLSFHSTKIEDKAVDLHVLCQAMHAHHHQIADFFSHVLTSYGDEDVTRRLHIVQKRGRNK